MKLFLIPIHSRTRFEKHGETEINGFEYRILLLIRKEEILGLKVSMHDAIGVTHSDDLGNGSGHVRGRTLAVVATCDDPVKEFATGTELHDEVNVLLVLVTGFELDDVGVVRQRGHDGDLAPHVLHVDGGPELALGDGLAGQLLLRLPVRAQIRYPELPPT